VAYQLSLLPLREKVRMRVETFEDGIGVVLEHADPHLSPLPQGEREKDAIHKPDRFLRFPALVKSWAV